MVLETPTNPFPKFCIIREINLPCELDIDKYSKKVNGPIQKHRGSGMD